LYCRCLVLLVDPIRTNTIRSSQVSQERNPSRCEFGGRLPNPSVSEPAKEPGQQAGRRQGVLQYGRNHMDCEYHPPVSRHRFVPHSLHGVHPTHNLARRQGVLRGARRCRRFACRLLRVLCLPSHLQVRIHRPGVARCSPRQTGNLPVDTRRVSRLAREHGIHSTSYFLTVRPTVWFGKRTSVGYRPAHNKPSLLFATHNTKGRRSLTDDVTATARQEMNSRESHRV
jgi:hypothetical protein